MPPDQFFEDGSRVLTPHAFEFVLDGELKRAVRSQNFLTLVVLETRREWNGTEAAADSGLVEKVAQVVGREVRDTDVLGRTVVGSLALVLLDADIESAAKVIDRLGSRIDSYAFPSLLHISVGAACYPTHAIDVESLKRQAISRPVVIWRGGSSPSRSSNSRN